MKKYFGFLGSNESRIKDLMCDSYLRFNIFPLRRVRFSKVSHLRVWVQNLIFGPKSGIDQESNATYVIIDSKYLYSNTFFDTCLSIRVGGLDLGSFRGSAPCHALIGLSHLTCIRKSQNHQGSIFEIIFPREEVS